ncbi:MAG: zinc ribbon domain-containing protein [Clostridia bacterium]|nr:zinc ribbon domain-containing protein [Clostridia bacterium]
MKCAFCGFESETDFAFCPSCGKEVRLESLDVAKNSNPAASLLLSVINDKLFFVLCVLLTVGSGFALISGNVNVISILATVFAWIVYTSAKNSNIADAKNLRCLSGTVYANYIITNISAVIFFVCAVIILLLSAVVSSNSAQFISELSDLLKDEFPSFLGEYSEMLLSVFSIILGILFIVVAAVVLIFNIFGLRNIHKFVKSAYICAETGVMNFEKCKTASTWLTVYGVLGYISALSALEGSLLGFISSVSLATVQIIAGMLIKKYFKEFI